MRFLTSLLVLALVLTSCGAKKSVTSSQNPTILGTTTNPTSSSSNYEPFLDITTYSTNEDYGIVASSPVKVGERSATNQRRFLASLAGPDGEELSFHRRGSCCPYESENGFGGSAMVDVYEVTYEGLKEPILVYISFYDYEKLYIPKGFTKRKL